MYLPNDVFASPTGRSVRKEFYTGIRVEEEHCDLSEDPTKKVAKDPETKKYSGAYMKQFDTV